MSLKSLVEFSNEHNAAVEGFEAKSTDLDSKDAFVDWLEEAAATYTQEYVDILSEGLLTSDFELPPRTCRIAGVDGIKDSQVWQDPSGAFLKLGFLVFATGDSDMFIFDLNRGNLFFGDTSEFHIEGMMEAAEDEESPEEMIREELNARAEVSWMSMDDYVLFAKEHVENFKYEEEDEGK